MGHTFHAEELRKAGDKMRTVEDCLRSAFSALLRDDMAERDRQCAMARHILKQSIRVCEGGSVMTEKEILVRLDLVQGTSQQILPTNPEGGENG